MPNTKSSRMFTLVRREMQESRNSLIWTPVVIAAGLALIMLVSVLLANRIGVGDTMLQVLLDEESAGSMDTTWTRHPRRAKPTARFASWISAPPKERPVVRYVIVLLKGIHSRAMPGIA